MAAKLHDHPATACGLMEIGADRAVLARVPLPVAIQAELRRRARVRSTHYSTRIDGNRLTLYETQEVIDERRITFHGRERDVAEVRNYWNALLRVEEWAAEKAPLTEKLIQRLHALVEHGVRARPTPYRDGQNVIRDSAVFASARDEVLRCSEGGVAATALVEPGAAREMGRERLACGGGSVPPGTGLCFIGKLSAIHRKFIGNVLAG